ncbi:hypothetical protein M4I93_03280 [Enterococcus faecium]|uniref:hypothetical protein n=1 Tax=Enterococcus faecium TaxID=1352 RepID=UPI0025430CF8|nr:hypothetical protein [Enterococcus faecium]MDK4377045.1 hypothetical protein [Enterococcus faecium]HAR8797028.1 hypothetical protein [Enterococcus faecium]
MKSLQQLISEKESELQNLEDSLGLGFPIVEQAKMVQISHLQLELEDLRQIEDPYQLNDNQQIVFDFLKNEFKRNDLQYTLWSFTEDVYERLEIGVSSLPYVKAWGKLKEKQQFEVLTAFAQWGLEQEEAG